MAAAAAMQAALLLRRPACEWEGAVCCNVHWSCMSYGSCLVITGVRTRVPQLASTQMPGVPACALHVWHTCDGLHTYQT